MWPLRQRWPLPHSPTVPRLHNLGHCKQPRRHLHSPESTDMAGCPGSSAAHHSRGPAPPALHPFFLVQCQQYSICHVLCLSPHPRLPLRAMRMLPAQGLSLGPTAESLPALEVRPQVLGSVVRERMLLSSSAHSSCLAPADMTVSPPHVMWLSEPGSGASCSGVSSGEVRPTSE